MGPLPGPKLRGKRTPSKTSAVWELSGGRGNRTECGRTTVRSQKRGPAQQVATELGKEEAVGRDPTKGLEHEQSCAFSAGLRKCLSSVSVNAYRGSRARQ